MGNSCCWHQLQQTEFMWYMGSCKTDACLSWLPQKKIVNQGWNRNGKWYRLMKKSVQPSAWNKSATQIGLYQCAACDELQTHSFLLHISSLPTGFFYYMLQMLKKNAQRKICLASVPLVLRHHKIFPHFKLPFLMFCFFFFFPVFPVLVPLHSCNSSLCFTLVFSQSGSHSKIFRCLWKIYKKICSKLSISPS